jgi:hypothetical protein
VTSNANGNAEAAAISARLAARANISSRFAQSIFPSFVRFTFVACNHHGYSLTSLLMGTAELKAELTQAINILAEVGA